MKPKSIPPLLLATILVGSAHASGVSWNGGTGSWDDTANWTPNALPGSSDTAIFTGTAGTVTATAAQSVLGLEFTSSGYTLAGNTLTLGTGGINAGTLTSGTTTINSPLFIGNGVQRWNVGAGATLATGTLGVGSGTTHTYDPLGGIVIIKGSVTTTAADGWGWRSGSVAGTGVLGPGIVLDNGDGTFDWASVGSQTAGTARAIVAATYTNAVNGDAHNVRVASNTTVSPNASWVSLLVNGATLTHNGANLYLDTGIILENGASINGSGPIKANSDGLYIYTPGTGGSISSSIQNNGANVKKLYKAGTGALTLSGLSTYTGGTIVHEGTLNLAKAADGSGNATIRGALTIKNGATVNTTASDAVGWNATNSVTTVTVSGGTFNNSTTSNQGYVTNIVLEGGTVSSTGGGAINFTTGKTLTSNASSTPSIWSAPIYLRDTGDFAVSVADGSATNDLVISGNITGNSGTPTPRSLTKSGDGTLVLGGTNNYTGVTTVSAGTLFVSGSLGGGVSVATGATIGAGDLDGALIAGDLQFGAGSFLDLTNGLLSVAAGKTVSFGGFDFSNLIGFDVYSAAVGTYTLLNGGFTLDSTNLNHFGAANQLDLGNGKSAYFEAGSLNVVVVPEPAAALLGGIGILALLRRRRN